LGGSPVTPQERTKVIGGARRAEAFDELPGDIQQLVIDIERR